MANYITGFQTKDGVKKYDYNALANLPASVTDATNTVISPNADYAEVGEWVDGNPSDEDRLGYFITVAEVGDNTIKIRKATPDDDVRGVTVYNPAFSGNASAAKYGKDGELLKQYNYVGIMGIIPVIDNGRCTVGGRCMPDEDGTAKPSANKMGYAVLERVDATHVLIAVEPGADMVQRVKTDILNLQDELEGCGAALDSIIAIQESLITGVVSFRIQYLAAGIQDEFSVAPGTTWGEWAKTPEGAELVYDDGGYLLGMWTDEKVHNSNGEVQTPSSVILPDEYSIHS